MFCNNSDVNYNDGAGSNPHITGNKFIDNDGKDHGGAMALHDDGTKPIISNNLFLGNHARGRGGGAIAVSYALPWIINNTFVGNRAYERNGYGNGGAILLKPASDVKIFNNVFRNNWAELQGQSIYDELGSGPHSQYIRFCDAWNDDLGLNNNDITHYTKWNGYYYSVISGVDGASCLYDNPLFVLEDPDPANGDYHLKLLPPNSISPCIDKGINPGAYEKIPTTDLDGCARPVDIPSVGYDGGDVLCDMGAYELQGP